MAERKSLSEVLHDYKVLEAWRHEKLLEAREIATEMENTVAVEFLNGLEELHYAYMKRREYFETVLRMIHINGDSLEPTESVKKILRCVRDLETMWKIHEDLLLGQNCQNAIKASRPPQLCDQPILRSLLLAFATTAAQYYELITLFDTEVRASPLAEYIFAPPENFESLHI